ncbi:MAG: hypothetical protein KKF33_13940, partial [Alphaproteobacteria bacterium]|nr:hypothetical protein [Alphaproteobacteria bacterium]
MARKNKLKLLEPILPPKPEPVSYGKKKETTNKSKTAPVIDLRKKKTGIGALVEKKTIGGKIAKAA